MATDHAVTIRPARVDDHDQILAMVRDAFTRGGQHGDEEVEIVEATWRLDASPEGLELVATDDDRVVGHVMGATADLAGRRDVAGVAPLAVAPSHQGRGIGSALVRELITRAGAAGFPLLALLGNPAYYGRFGFEPSGPLGITYRPVGPDNPHFQVLRLAGYDPSLRGDFTYCWELPGEALTP